MKNQEQQPTTTDVLMYLVHLQMKSSGFNFEYSLRIVKRKLGL